VVDGPVLLVAASWARRRDGKDQIAGLWKLTVPLLMRESRDHQIWVRVSRRQETGQQRQGQRLRICRQGYRRVEQGICPPPRRIQNGVTCDTILSILNIGSRTHAKCRMEALKMAPMLTRSSRCRESRYWRRREKTGPCRIVGSAGQSTE
jgi:hypothetical protein